MTQVQPQSRLRQLRDGERASAVHMRVQRRPHRQHERAARGERGGDGSLHRVGAYAHRQRADDRKKCRTVTVSTKRCYAVARIA